MCVCVLQEASKNAEELLRAEEQEKKAAEKKKKRNRKVSMVTHVLYKVSICTQKKESKKRRKAVSSNTP